MAGDVLIICLPNEIIEQILENSILSFRDICHFGSTCSKFGTLVCSSNKLWKTKFQQQWPNLRDVYDAKRSFVWRDEFMRRFQCGRSIRHFISEMSPKFYRKDEISYCDLVFIDTLLQGHEYAYYFIISELLSIVNDGELFGNLTEKFYSEKVIRYVRKVHLRKKWYLFCSLPPKDRTFEKGAVLVAQWCQPLAEVKYKNIAKQLDDISIDVKTELLKKHNNHPLFHISCDKFIEWRNKNIEDNQWKPIECQQVLEALRTVLFAQMGFHVNCDMYCNVENSFLNKVLEHRSGIPITLAIVYESVARRLGVKCEPVDFPSHFLLSWQEKYRTEEELNPSYIIDLYSGQLFMKGDCPNCLPNSLCPMRETNTQPANFVQVVERLVNNLQDGCQWPGKVASLQSTLELMHLVNPLDMNCVYILARFYMLNHMKWFLGDLVAELKETQDNLGIWERDQAARIIEMMHFYESHYYNKEAESLADIEPKLRTPEVKYAVGMIMCHLHYNYTCVIYGWDPCCNASQEWLVDHLPFVDQPYYNVLVEDGSTRYVAQENLEVAINPMMINHVGEGRYFKRFCGTHYIPNTEKEEEYPQDAEVRLRFVSISDSEIYNLILLL